VNWSSKTRAGVVGLSGAALALVVFWGTRIRSSANLEPLDTVPRDSFMVVTADLAEFRRSPIAEAVFGKENAPKELGTAKALGMGGLAEACGFDPLSRVQRLAVSVPEEGDRGDFGVAARVEVTRDELEKCTKALGDKRGSRAETREVGPFVVLEDAGHRQIAYGADGLLVVGKGSWFDAMLGAARREKPRLDQASEHVALRSALTNRDGWRTPTIVVTALLPRSLRDRLKSEMGAEVDAQDTSATIMAGVLGVSGVGLAIRAGAPGENVDARLELDCDSTESCASVTKLIQKKRLDWSKDFGLRMIGFGALVDSLQVDAKGAHLSASVSANANALAAALERALKLRHGSPADALGIPGGTGAGRDPTPRTDDTVEPSAQRTSARIDEQVSARDAGGALAKPTGRDAERDAGRASNGH
jgi:hypothetical protein